MLTFYTLLSFGFAWVVFHIGRTMFETQSTKDALEQFQKNPRRASWVEKYFYGWIFPSQVKLMKRLTSGKGNDFLTFWLRFSGLIFMSFALIFTAGTITLWCCHIMTL